MRAHWEPVLTHPEVEPRVLMGLATVDEFMAWIGTDEVCAEPCEGGGFVFVDKGAETEVHVAFTPDYHGRHAAHAMRNAIASRLAAGQTLVAREQEGYWKSRPPLSQGWRVDGDFINVGIPVRLRRWILTPDAWYRSPVGRRYA